MRQRLKLRREEQEHKDKMVSKLASQLKQKVDDEDSRIEKAQKERDAKLQKEIEEKQAKLRADLAAIAEHRNEQVYIVILVKHLHTMLHLQIMSYKHCFLVILDNC